MAGWLEETRIYGCIVIKGVSDNLTLRSYGDLVISVFLVPLLCFILVDNENIADDMTVRRRNLMPLLIVAIVVFILRIPLTILTEIGNNTENLRLLWLGLVGQKITFAIGIVLAVVALLISGNVLGSSGFLVLLGFWPIFLIVLVGKRIKEINNKADAILTQHDQNQFV